MSNAKREFKRMVLGEFPKKSQDYEIYLNCWLAYHRAADAIDGYIDIPRTYGERKICALAGRKGMQALKKELEKYGLNISLVSSIDWHNAKADAAKIVGKMSNAKRDRLAMV